MRTIMALTLAATVLGLGGCFHHRQVYTEEVLTPPPVAHPPFK
jgi:LPS O-antigen subunit length determinant protein (WzzB/FepE family)